MILRLWRGWTTAAAADAYEDLIRGTIFPGILARRIDGLERIELFRRALSQEVEFMTLMRFESWEAVKVFAGSDYEVSVVPPAARKILARFDERATHYESGVDSWASTCAPAAAQRPSFRPPDGSPAGSTGLGRGSPRPRREPDPPG